MKKKIFLLIGAFLLVFVLSGCGKPQVSDETDGKNGEAVVEENEEKAEVRAVKPARGEEIDSPLEISGEARGAWFFEAGFPVRLEDEKGKVLARAVAIAQGDWMTEEFVPFKAVLTFDAQDAVEGKIILEKDNPSGLPENDDSFTVPVKFSQTKTMTVKVFFGNEKNSQGTDCAVVYPLERTIAKTQKVGREAINQMLAGPITEERAQGYFTSINAGVKLQVLNIQHGVAFIDFDGQLEKNVGGSCRVTAIRAQIIETLKQFPTVKEVIISINGRMEDILQP